MDHPARTSPTLPAIDGLSTSTWSVSAYPVTSVDAFVAMVLLVVSACLRSLSAARTEPLTARSTGSSAHAVDAGTDVPALESRVGSSIPVSVDFERVLSGGSIEVNCSHNRPARHFRRRRRPRELRRRALLRH